MIALGRTLKDTCRLTLALPLLAALTALPAASQITAPGTDYPTFWSGELRILAQRPGTLVALINLDDGQPFGLPGDPAPDSRLSGGPCHIVAADGAIAELPTNPFLLAERGAMFRCTAGLGGPQDEARVRILAEDATGAGELKPVTVWTGSQVTETGNNSWGSFLPADLSAGDTFGRELGSSFVGFTGNEVLIIAPRVEGVTTTIAVRNLDSGAVGALALDASLPACPAMTSLTVPAIATAQSPCYYHADGELQVVYDSNYANDRIDVTSNVAISVLTGYRLVTWVPDDLTANHKGADWTATPPSWTPGDEGIELGTLFYTFARQALTVFPTEHDTTVEIIDLSDGDDSRTLLLEHGDVFEPKVPGEPRLSLFTPIRGTPAGNLLSERVADPAIDLATADENPFDNDVVKIVSDKPILVYQGPAASNGREYADIAYSVPLGPQRRLVYAYAQNFGGSNDFQLFSFPGPSMTAVDSLSYTEGFGGINDVPGHHDFVVEFSDALPPEVTTAPDHEVYVTHGLPGGIQHFGSGTWSGELLMITSERPVTVINGDYDTPFFGAYVPFVPTSRDLPPVAVLASDAASSCFGSAASLTGAGSFDQDSEGDDPQIVLYEWAFGDGSGLSTTAPEVDHTYAAPGDYTVVLTVVDNEGNRDSDELLISVLAPGTGDCEPCGPCEGKVTELTLRYEGDGEAVLVEIFQRSGRHRIEVFDGVVRPGEEFSIVGLDRRGTLGPEIEIRVDGVAHTRIHTSCSQPIGAGQRHGDFLIVAGRSRTGGLLCPYDGGDTGDDDSDGDSDSDSDSDSDGDSDSDSDGDSDSDSDGDSDSDSDGDSDDDSDSDSGAKKRPADRRRGRG